MTALVKPYDVFQLTNGLGRAALDDIITHLEVRGRHPQFRQMMHEYLDAMQVDAAHAVLDLGCGTGIVAREVAARAGFTGHIIGIDLSDSLVEMARHLAAEEGVGDRITLITGDIHGLNVPGDSFDAVIAHSLLSHIADPLAALQEIARVVKRGGTVGIFDSDYASFTFGSPDPGHGRNYDQLIVDALIARPFVMRQMPRLLQAAGLRLVKHFSYVVTDVGTASYWGGTVNSVRKLLPQSGVMSAMEAEVWAEERMQESKDGTFYAASVFCSYVVHKE
jgi:ubiquinone/menaquinone biosynthesis C-methylase UbiE